jgi:glutathione S-transferase
MGDELVFYTNPMSRGRMVRWLLEEVGRPYRTVLLDYGTSMKEQSFLAINPMGKVPALTHGDAVITEGAAICTYLADAFPEKELAPAIGDKARARYLRWMFFAAGPLEQAVTNQALGLQPPAEQSRMIGYGSLEVALDTIEAAVAASPYIAGDRFSAADIFLSGQIGWGVMSVAKERAPKFKDYLDRINQRPAAIRAREIDDTLLAQASEAETT